MRENKLRKIKSEKVNSELQVLVLINKHLETSGFNNNKFRTLGSNNKSRNFRS